MNFVSRSQLFVRSLLKRKPLVMGLLLLLGVFVFTHATPVFAQQAVSGPVDDSAINTVINNASSVNCSNASGCLLQVVGFVITFIFSIISYFLSKLLVVLTSVLITFARYNKFNIAPPVTIGWVIVRDISNMFFIVVLLISAFMTIVGKAEDFGFHYSKVIPKLLVAAVLVNFSRTIILLMIDFSQVVTLTFVSAFEGTIAGNLIQGLGITQMVNFQNAQNATAGGAQVGINLVNIALAYLLSIFLLTIAVATILIYVGYFIYRIVGLWMILIFSPIAFLADSLPKSVSSHLGGITKDYWSKLGTFLSGGPIIAFCLWLTFATIQQTATSGGFAGSNIGFDFPADSALGFITQIGTAPQLAGFIVGVVMLMAGFNLAVKTAGDVGGGLETVAKTIKGYANKSFSTFARAPLSIGKGIGRAGVGAARYGINTIDRRNNISGQLGAGIARGRAGMPATAGVFGRAGGMIGDAARFIPGIGGAAAAGAGGALVARKAALVGAEKKKLETRMGDISKLSPDERVAALRNLRDDTDTDTTLLEKQHEELSKDENRKVLVKQLENEAKADLTAKAVAAGGTVNAAEIGRQATAIAAKKVRDEESARIDQLRKYADDVKDTTRADALKKEAEKKMFFATDAEYDKEAAKYVDDPTKMKDLDPELMKSGRFAMAVISKMGISDGTKPADLARLETARETLKDQKELVQTINLVADQLGVASKGDLQNAVRQKDAYGAPRLYSTASNGEAMYSPTEASAMATMRSSGTRAANTPLNTAQRGAVDQAVRAGLPASMIATMMEKDATGVSDGMVTSHLATVSTNTINGISTSQQVIKNLHEFMEMAQKGGASQERRIELAATSVADDQAFAKVFGDYKSLSGQEKKNVVDIIDELVTLETAITKKGGPTTAQETKIMDGLIRLRTEFFPETKLTAHALPKIDRVTTPATATSPAVTVETLVYPVGDVQPAAAGIRNSLHNA